MTSRGPDNERGAEDAQWRVVAAAHFAFAGHLTAAGLTLELAASNLDDEGIREVILDQAQTHRAQTKQLAANGAALVDVLVTSLREKPLEPDPVEAGDELRAALHSYGEAMESAAAEAERSLLALDRSTSGTSGPATIMANMARFLNHEAALLATLLED